MPDPAPHRTSQPGENAPEELVATALASHRALSRGLRQGIPDPSVAPILTPSGSLNGLAAFLAVYAAQQKRARR